MTPFETSVSQLMAELTRHSEAGLITYQALVLMGPVQQHLNRIQKLERLVALGLAPPPAPSEQQPEGNQNA